MWSAKVVNDEAAILEAIGTVLARAGQVVWAVDVTGTMSGLLLDRPRRVLRLPVPARGVRSFVLPPDGHGGDYKVEKNSTLFPVLADALGLDKVRVLRTPIDQMGAEREQWTDGNNFLALSRLSRVSWNLRWRSPA